MQQLKEVFMLTLIHAPQSRSWRIIALIDEMGIWDKVDIRRVGMVGRDGLGSHDPSNPHPEGKVPALIHDGTLITESGAIMLYLTALFPDSGMAPKPGTSKRGEYLTWLFWYQGILEPVMWMKMFGADHPGLHRNFRGVDEAMARLHAALEKGPFLCGDDFTAADLICASTFAFLPQFLPEDQLIRDWVARCQARPSVQKAKDFDQALLAAA
jgi:glutathione S-transferase